MAIPIRAATGHGTGGGFGMSRYEMGRDGGIRFVALPGVVKGYGGRGVEGAVYRPQAGNLFCDGAGGTWWIIFQISPDARFQGAQVRGDVLACSASHDAVIQVRVLASDVLRVDADAAFGQNAPSNYEEAVAVAARILPAGG